MEFDNRLPSAQLALIAVDGYNNCNMMAPDDHDLTISYEPIEALACLQTKLGIAFNDLSLLQRALRHRSIAMELGEASNERMEFLGDSLVGVVVCDWLFREFPDASEGIMAKAKAYLVCEPTLAEAARAIGVPSALDLSTPESIGGGRDKPSILSDALEALIAAIYLDQGLEAVFRVVRLALEPAMERVRADDYLRDYKSALQEVTQSKQRETPSYVVFKEEGEPHRKTFHVEVMVNGQTLGTGSGQSKKMAEQAAAYDALIRLRPELGRAPNIDQIKEE